MICSLRLATCFLKLMYVAVAEGLRDRSGKPGEGTVGGFVPDLKRMARTAADKSTAADSPKA
jgi:hypothetical protein